MKTNVRCSRALPAFAAAMYAELEAVELRHQIAMLERKFKAPSQRVR